MIGRWARGVCETIASCAGPEHEGLKAIPPPDLPVRNGKLEMSHCDLAPPHGFTDTLQHTADGFAAFSTAEKLSESADEVSAAAAASSKKAASGNTVTLRSMAAPREELQALRNSKNAALLAAQPAEPLPPPGPVLSWLPIDPEAELHPTAPKCNVPAEWLPFVSDKHSRDNGNAAHKPVLELAAFAAVDQASRGQLLDLLAPQGASAALQLSQGSSAASQLPDRHNSAADDTAKMAAVSAAIRAAVDHQMRPFDSGDAAAGSSMAVSIAPKQHSNSTRGAAEHNGKAEQDRAVANVTDMPSNAEGDSESEDETDNDDADAANDGNSDLNVQHMPKQRPAPNKSAPQMPGKLAQQHGSSLQLAAAQMYAQEAMLSLLSGLQADSADDPASAPAQAPSLANLLSAAAAEVPALAKHPWAEAHRLCAAPVSSEQAAVAQVQAEVLRACQPAINAQTQHLGVQAVRFHQRQQLEGSDAAVSGADVDASIKALAVQAGEHAAEAAMDCVMSNEHAGVRWPSKTTFQLITLLLFRSGLSQASKLRRTLHARRMHN